MVKSCECTPSGTITTVSTLYEFEHYMEAWHMSSEVEWHHQSCDGSTS